MQKNGYYNTAISLWLTAEAIPYRTQEIQEDDRTLKIRQQRRSVNLHGAGADWDREQLCYALPEPIEFHRIRVSRSDGRALDDGHKTV
jgi:hypothetical protein